MRFAIDRTSANFCCELSHKFSASELDYHSRVRLLPPQNRSASRRVSYKTLPETYEGVQSRQGANPDGIPRIAWLVEIGINARQRR